MLTQQGIEGYTGSTGYMPPKGGWADLSDGEIGATVDFMIGELNQALLHGARQIASH